MSKLKTPKRCNLWVERFLAITATVNLGLVAFDLSYVPWRDVYLQKLPKITHIYDPIKGIEAHRDTQKYLNTVAKLEKQVSVTGLTSPKVETQLSELRSLSAKMIISNPFVIAGKSGTLEKIKDLMRYHLGQESATQSFGIFWSQPYLLAHGWKQEINFFDQKIRPLMATNYYRKIGENGAPLDKFWELDLVFITLFALEFLVRIFSIKRQHHHLSWLETVLWRWYDLFLLLPFWRWLRVIPVLVRLDQAQLLDFQVVRQQLHRGIIANLAGEITEIVVVRVINQIQGSIKRGELTGWLRQQENLRPYIHLNNANEVEAIANLFLNALIYQILPKIQPEIIAIIRYNIEKVCRQLPISNNLLTLPGVGQVQNQLSEQLATQITIELYSFLFAAAKDSRSAELISQLVKKFNTVLASEFQQKQINLEVQTLLAQFLEEIKLNYIQHLSQEDIEQIIDQTRQMRTQSPAKK